MNPAFPHSRLQNVLFTFFFLNSLLFANLAHAKPPLSGISEENGKRLAVFASSTNVFADAPIGAKSIKAANRGGKTIDILIKHKIDNPIRRITATLANHLVENHGFSVVSMNSIPLSDEKPNKRRALEIANTGDTADYILSLSNSAWFTMSEVGKPENYKLNYAIELELFDAKTGKVIVKSSKTFSPNTGNPWDSRAEDGAKLFIAAHDETTMQAIEYYKNEKLK